jgi:hypothetical protein
MKIKEALAIQEEIVIKVFILLRVRRTKQLEFAVFIALDQNTKQWKKYDDII